MAVLLELSTLSVSDLTIDPEYEELDWELLDTSLLCFMMDVREGFLACWLSCFPVGGLEGARASLTRLTGDSDLFRARRASESEGRRLALESGVGAMEADRDLASMASLCFARLAAVLPKIPGLGERLRVLLVSLLPLLPCLFVLRLPPSA